ncbi:MAG: serine protease [Pseudomonadota bacterium]|nr:serine protease [Pseudomonadota bacterium]
MDKNLIVEIFVPKTGTGCKKGEIATGYPVARNLILTARHVLYPQETRRDDACNIEVRWRHPNVKDKGWRPITGVVWESEPWDLALLECPLPRKSPTGVFSATKSLRTRWHGSAWDFRGSPAKRTPCASPSI